MHKNQIIFKKEKKCSGDRTEFTLYLLVKFLHHRKLGHSGLQTLKVKHRSSGIYPADIQPFDIFTYALIGLDHVVSFLLMTLSLHNTKCINKFLEQINLLIFKTQGNIH